MADNAEQDQVPTVPRPRAGFNPDRQDLLWANPANPLEGDQDQTVTRVPGDFNLAMPPSHYLSRDELPAPPCGIPDFAWSIDSVPHVLEFVATSAAAGASWELVATLARSARRRMFRRTKSGPIDEASVIEAAKDRILLAEPNIYRSQLAAKSVRFLEDGVTVVTLTAIGGGMSYLVEVRQKFGNHLEARVSEKRKSLCRWWHVVANPFGSERNQHTLSLIDARPCSTPNPRSQTNTKGGHAS